MFYTFYTSPIYLLSAAICECGRKLVEFALQSVQLFSLLLTPSGLLNNPPVEVKEELKEALMMCVEEMEAGGRLEAVQGLQELLQKYTQ